MERISKHFLLMPAKLQNQQNDKQVKPVMQNNAR